MSILMYVPEVSEGMLVRIVGFPVTQSITSQIGYVSLRCCQVGGVLLDQRFTTCEPYVLRNKYWYVIFFPRI